MSLMMNMNPITDALKCLNALAPSASAQQEERLPANPMVKETVKRIIAEQLGVGLDDVEDDASFVDDLCADDLDADEIIGSLEDKFGLKISSEDAEKITTVRTAIDYIDCHLFGPKRQLPEGDPLINELEEDAELARRRSKD